MNKEFKLLVFSLSCAALIMSSSCRPVLPESPDVSVDERWRIPDQPVSIIDIPIAVNLKPYFKETDASVPKKFTGEEATCDGVSYAYSFHRDPIRFEGKKDLLEFDVKGKYALKLNYCPQCTELFNSKGNCIIPRIYTSCGVDEPMREMQVVYTTKIGVAEDFKLTSKTSLKKVKSITPCEITVFSYNASETLEEEVTASLKDLEKEIDKEIGNIDLRPDFAETWELLHEPTDLEGYGFLYLNPKGIAISKINYIGDSAFIHASLIARPNIFLDRRDYEVNELPNLKKYKSQDGFDIAMDVEAQYDSLSSIINANLKGTKIDLKGKEIVIEEISIFGAMDHKISLKVRFSGKKKGILYLTGTPGFDLATQKLSFPDLEFDIKTRSALLKSAKWLFDKKVSDKIRQAAQVDLRPYLDSLKLMVNESLNGEISEGVYMKGRVKEVSINNIQPRSDFLFIRVLSKGELEIKM